jgi:hypothetical protein
MAAISDSRKKKRGRGRPSTGIGKAIGLRLYPDLERRLDAWMKAQSPRPSRPEAIRALVDQALVAAEHAVMPLAADAGRMTPPEAESASPAKRARRSR